ncbi:MAG: hypothetical protein GAK45_00111 [Pseudomonas citronellolis]|nr:MAG: hypothetical protein GAK45_00111 [Pseudomonas citronellolis]
MSGGGGYKALCPACGHPMQIRSSAVQSPVFKTMYAQCTYLPCSASFSGSLSWDFELSPSGLDKPRTSLPVAPSVARMKALRDNKKKTDQLDLLDDTLPMEATA